MSTLKVNNIIPFSGQTVNIQGDFLPSSGSNTTQSLGSVSNPWADLYISTGSVNFVAPGAPIAAVVASLKAGGENGVTGPITGMIFTETNGFRGSFSVGRNNLASGTASLANGQSNTASGDYSHAEGFGNRATGQYSHAEGNANLANGALSHAEGASTSASGNYSHAEGNGALSIGSYSHAEGYQTTAFGTYSHAEGYWATSSGDASHAEGYLTWATGSYSHAEGGNTIASGQFSHTEGTYTVASGQYSHAGGTSTTASGMGAFTHGLNIEAPGVYQTVVGQNNVTGNSASLFVVGAGTTSGNRKNGFSVELDPNTTQAHIVIPVGGGNPTNPKTASMYFNPASNLMYIYNGTAWRSASFA
jgi:hypothetical protein